MKESAILKLLENGRKGEILLPSVKTIVFTKDI